MSEQNREEIEQLYADWEEACADEEDAASRASLAEAELIQLGIDPWNPPEWLHS